MAESAALVTTILQGRASSAQENVTCANAALAMWSYEGKGELAQYIEKARESVRSGRAFEALRRSQEV
jgi:anthranilate phosphoribosyltransferase